MLHTSDNPWRDALHARFRGQPTPLLVMPDALWTAASLWAGTRAWTKAFRSMALASGDVVSCALPAGPAFVQVLLACLWDGVTFAPCSVSSDASMSGNASFGTRLLIGPAADSCIAGVSVLVPDAACQPPALLPELAGCQRAEPGIALQCAEGGAGGTVGWSAVSLLAAARSVAAQHRMDGGCVLSVMPWQRSAEVIGDVLGPLLHADELLVGDDMSLQTTLRLVHEHPVTHIGLDAVTADVWRATAAGHALLDRLAVRVSQGGGTTPQNALDV